VFDVKKDALASFFVGVISFFDKKDNFLNIGCNNERTIQADNPWIFIG
jgi:hypothetical protein